jgi:small subunit ribosomal protein S5
MDNRGQYNTNREFEEKVVEIKRISKKTKGGNTIRFSALVVVGDRKSKVGVGLSKAPAVANAIKKSIRIARNRMVDVPKNGTTIPYSIYMKYGAAKILLKPAPPGSGIIAGGAIRVVLEAAGIHNAVGKILGSRNKTSNVYTTVRALTKLAQITEKKQNK